jgi:small subunit ribosomal protein S6
MMRPYELVVLLHPDLEIDPSAPIEKLEKLVSAGGGKVVKRDNWGKKRLAYPIKKQDFAIYIYFELQLPPDQVRELNQTILLTEEVIRYILVAHETVKLPSEQETKAGAAAKAKKPEPVTAVEAV